MGYFLIAIIGLGAFATHPIAILLLIIIGLLISIVEKLNKQ